ncbi:type IX secretion system membrane protein PorP/SprF [bacterium]|nr:type IX secretion system membrane protein PorP/SprF [bacterium]
MPLFLFASIAFAGTPRTEGGGGVFVPAMSGTDGIGGNPAAIAGNANYRISVDATKYWLGLSDDNIFGSRAAFVLPDAKYGSMGLELRQFGNGVQNRFDIGAAYAYSVGLNDGKALSLGVYGRWIRNQYDVAEFYRFEEDPLFDRYGNSADGFGLDAGALYRSRSVVVGFVGRNLVEPSLALSGGSGEGESEPIELSAGAAYSGFGWIVPSAQVSWSKTSDIDGAGGLELRAFDGALCLRGGYRHGGATFGLGIVGKKGFPLTFDYALYYPNETLSRAGLTTHSIGITASIAPRVRHPKEEHPPEMATGLPDIMAAVDPELPETLLAEIGVEKTYRAIIVNVGDVPIGETAASVFLLGQDSSMVDTPFKIPKLEAGERFPIEWKWTPQKPGSYSFLVSADDDGSRFPLRNGKISELSIANNTVEIPLYVIGPVEAAVTPEYSSLEIESITYIAEDEPLIPVVFFEKGKSSVAARFDPTLDVLARRASENPDVVITLKGYVDRSSDPATWASDSLNIARAVAVRRRMLDLGADSVVVEREGYDPTAPRITISAKYESMQDMIWAQQENRRVEMSTSVKGFDGDIIHHRFSDGPDLPRALRDSVVALGPELADYLDRNPELSLIFEGFARSEDEWKKVYEILDGLRRRFLAGVGIDMDLERFPVLVEVKKRGAIRVYLSGEGLLYRPVEAALAAKDFEIPANEKRNKISIDVADGVIARYSIVIVDRDSVDIREIAAGDGFPPKEVYWDWRDRNGNLVDPQKTYRVELSAIDPAGGVWNSYSPEIRVRVAEKERRMESTIIVQFAFDEVVSTSEFLESRIESMAKRIEKLGESGSRIGVKIIGHTDPMGSDRRNTILSQQRAERKERDIRRYLRHFVGVDSDPALERWLSDHHITLVRQGMADKDPYEVERYRDGRFEKVLLGNNVFPEGRAANRRVIIQIEEIKEHRSDR